MVTEARIPSKQLSIPVDLVLRNVDCDSSVYVGAAVRTDSLGVIYNALADSSTNSNVVGIVESKASSILCDVRVLGITLEIFLGLDVTKEYFLSAITPGLITTTIPTTSGHMVVNLGKPWSATEFLFIGASRMRRS